MARHTLSQRLLNRLRRRAREALAFARTLPGRAWRGLAALRQPAARERLACASAYALIAAFGLTSMDYLLTAGPQWSPGPAAIELVSAAEAAPLFAAPAAFAAAEAPPAPREQSDLSLDYSAAVSADDLLGAPRPLWAEAGGFQFASFTLDAPLPDEAPPMIKPQTMATPLLIAAAPLSKARTP